MITNEIFSLTDGLSSLINRLLRRPRLVSYIKAKAFARRCGTKLLANFTQLPQSSFDVHPDPFFIFVFLLYDERKKNESSDISDRKFSFVIISWFNEFCVIFFNGVIFFHRSKFLLIFANFCRNSRMKRPECEFERDATPPRDTFASSHVLRSRLFTSICLCRDIILSQTQLFASHLIIVF